MDSTKDSFSSKWGLIFAAAGSAIGLGNIWLFPYRVGELGGSAFVIPYVICLIILGFIAIVGEITVGRITGSGPVGAFQKAAKLGGINEKAGAGFGWICTFVALIQAIGYILVVSWVVRFVVGSCTGSAFHATDSIQYFNVISTTQIVLWIVISIVVSAIAIIKGIEKGIERCCKFMIPAVIVLLLVLAVRVAFLPDAIEGYKYLITPRWGYLLDARTWMLALGQVFYSLSLRGSTMVVYGSYAKKSQDMISSAKHIVVLDTIASIIAAMLIIPAVFAFGKNLNSGPSLLFITLPEIFKGLPLGQFLMLLFFIAVFFASLTSLIGMLEVVVEVLQNKFKMVRWVAVILVSIVAVLLCKWFVVGNIRGVIDVLSLHLIPLCALGSGIFVFWIIPKHLVIQEIQSGHSKPIGKWMIHMGRYVFCGITILIYVLHIK
ncbi:MAG: sodium-dependent transporter [Endomicrobium sp.]|nr:sodium-dependent transporter [Endomicrobium sp.]